MRHTQSRARAGRRTRRGTLAAPPPDPFGEQREPRYRERLRLLGGDFEFQTDSNALLRLVRSAYAGLPQHALSGAPPQYRISMAVAPAGTSARAAQPALVQPLSGAGLLCGNMQGSTFVALSPGERSAVLIASRPMLRYPYHLRYELLEFAVYVLAARVQRLVPLHAACIGQGGSGLLLLGRSGVGKSTLVLHALLAGLDFLAEDSVLVEPESLLATGIPTFVHLRHDTLRFLSAPERRRLLRRGAPIQRRSGVRKLEIDLRDERFRLASAPLPIRALIFLSAARARGGALLRPLARASALRALAASQRYAASQPGWDSFLHRVGELPVFELRRAAHPREAVQCLQQLIVSGCCPGA